MSAEWKQFENAVAAFLQALDPSAKVSHDELVADVDTRLPRQRDVWIETSFGGHFPIKLLVSCKRKKTKISQQDMDAFIGELRSSGAHKGVLYSHGGFSKPALVKAERVGISCCVLYENRPPEIPEVLKFAAVCYREQGQLAVEGLPSGADLTWTDVLELPVDNDGVRVPAVSALAELFHADEEDLRARLGSLPPPCRRVEVAPIIEGANAAAKLILQSSWTAFRAKLESWLVNGSYSLTDGDFKGSISSPSIDTWSSHPGPGWEQVGLADLEEERNVISFYFFGGDVETVWRKWAAERGDVPTEGIP